MASARERLTAKSGANKKLARRTLDIPTSTTAEIEAMDKREEDNVKAIDNIKSEIEFVTVKEIEKEEEEFVTVSAIIKEEEEKSLVEEETVGEDNERVVVVEGKTPSDQEYEDFKERTVQTVVANMLVDTGMVDANVEENTEDVVIEEPQKVQEQFETKKPKKSTKNSGKRASGLKPKKEPKTNYSVRISKEFDDMLTKGLEALNKQSQGDMNKSELTVAAIELCLGLPENQLLHYVDGKEITVGKGAFALTIKRPVVDEDKNARFHSLSFRAEKEFLEKIKRQAYARGISVNTFVIDCVYTVIENNK